MRQCWTQGPKKKVMRLRRLSHPRFFAVAVAILVMTVSAVAAAGHTAPKADCTTATAKQLVNEHRLNDFDLPNPVSQLLCGPFTGPGSEAMAVAVAAPTCWGRQRWAVFNFTGGAWQLALDQIDWIFELKAVGADIRERSPVFRAGDPRCLPSGGSHARLWHWDGTRLVPGPWKQVTPGKRKFTYGYLRTPSGNVHCDWGYGGASHPWVRCGIKSGIKPPPPKRGPHCTVPDRIAMHTAGRAQLSRSICPGEDEEDAGPFARPGRVLAYGKSWAPAGIGLRCSSAFKGLTCRNKSGHGWFMSRARTRRF
jgi:hypothetical protein